jgi:hypothetical protein
MDIKTDDSLSVSIKVVPVDMQVIKETRRISRDRLQPPR